MKNFFCIRVELPYFPWIHFTFLLVFSFLILSLVPLWPEFSREGHLCHGWHCPCAGRSQQYQEVTARIFQEEEAKDKVSRGSPWAAGKDSPPKVRVSMCFHCGEKKRTGVLKQESNVVHWLSSSWRNHGELLRRVAHRREVHWDELEEFLSGRSDNYSFSVIVVHNIWKRSEWRVESSETEFLFFRVAIITSPAVLLKVLSLCICHVQVGPIKATVLLQGHG